jgi:DNA-binding GntR family transcriptional regulator
MAHTRSRPRLLFEERQVEERHDAGRRNLSDLAYEQIEDLIVHCELRPGCSLTMQDLQDLTGYGRTPVHQAVSRLAADTLIIVQPQHGLKIAAVDLARERLLLGLRRDVERFVIRLATERSGPSDRNQMLHMSRRIRERRGQLTPAEFNVFDRRLDALLLSAAGEPFLEHTLRPLQTIFRRIGWLHHSCVDGPPSLSATVDCHLAVLEAVASRDVAAAIEATDALMCVVDRMFDAMELEIDPALLDCSVLPLFST